jgi:serine/threonine protein phosphatase PrpC
MSLAVRTPFGRPVNWAHIALASDIGDSHPHNDDRCLVLSGHRLGGVAESPLDDFLLCVLTDGATGSTFAQGAKRPAGWRASQLAEGAFVETFLKSDEPDILERLETAIKAADAALATSREGTLSSTLTAVFVGHDGTAYAVSVGDSVLLAFSSRRDRPEDRRLKKLGYEESTALGTGETLLPASESGGARTIERWWPGMEGDGSRTRLAPGTSLVLLSDGVSGSLPADAIGRIVAGRHFEQVADTIVQHTRQRRLDARWREGAPTSETGLDNMTVVALRFHGIAARPMPRNDATQDGWLVSVVGYDGGPTPDVGGAFGITCLADFDSRGVLASFLRSVLEGDVSSEESLNQSFGRAHGDPRQTRLAVVTTRADGATATFAAGGAAVA